MDVDYKKFRRQIAVDVHLEKCLNDPDIILIFQKRRIIAVFQCGGINFMEDTCEKHKYLAIKRLLTNNYIEEDLAKHLVQKYCYDFFCNHEKQDTP